MRADESSEEESCTSRTSSMHADIVELMLVATTDVELSRMEYVSNIVTSFLSTN